ncbi:MAG: CUAEP/CCAEP-tail radical SAM (seleno)protein, partial [Terriglobia bacterium]
MNVLLISTYELGHQPFGLASPAAWLRQAGFSVVCLDLAREPMREELVRQADFIAFYLPMHTATRLAARVAPAARRLNPAAHMCFYGLYAPLNADYLRKLGAQTILGGEFEGELVKAAGRVRDGLSNGAGEQPAPFVSLDRLNFVRPDRDGLPHLNRYAHLENTESGSRVVG